MEENIKITKLPDILNPNKIAEDKILEKYGTCQWKTLEYSTTSYKY